ncbi:hypothetical protein C8A00DRAFT_34935 [Chaetomidium leptoderma]|uniref:Uncharacterized protein n=1 Tax=Chaetomidium leptoderma TaxID=669021 RepID=A0AAN6ZW26_9PEZI|nr:hypothetical protein C8A00DRAFT_34935 [Chaetomidium leptoderma]
MSCQKSEASEKAQGGCTDETSQNQSTELALPSSEPTMTGLEQDDAITEEDIDRAIHMEDKRDIFAAGTMRACSLNYTTAVVFLPTSAAELQDLKRTDKDPKTLPGDADQLSLIRIEKNTQDGTFRRFWPKQTCAHIDRTCTRMWRPKKRVRQQINDQDATEDSMMELYTRCFPDRATGAANNSDDGTGSDEGSGDREILLPSLVTFVSRGAAAAADGGPATEIKYLPPGARDRQDRQTFCQNLTDSFACERVRAPDIGARWHPNTSHIRRRFVGKFADARLGPTEFSHTMLVFVAGVCIGTGARAKGGIGIAVKDTVHHHEPKVQNRLVAAEGRLYKAQASKTNPSDVRKMRLCVAALNKPNRGHTRNLYPAGSEESAMIAVCHLLGGFYNFALERRGPMVDPEVFGMVESRYRPAWKTIADDKINAESYDRWLKTQATVEGGVEEAKGEDDDAGAEKVANEEESHGKKAKGEETTTEETHGEGDAPNKAEEEADGTTTTTDQPKAKPKKPKTCPPTPNRAAARALLAAVQLTAYDFGHCTRLVIATASDHAIDMATSRLGGMLERRDNNNNNGESKGASTSGNLSLPLLRTAKGKPVEDEDIWWAFAGAVRDLAYQGVEVALVKCPEDQGVFLPSGHSQMAVVGGDDDDDNDDDDGCGGGGSGEATAKTERKVSRVFGMPQAVAFATIAAEREVARPEFGRVIGPFL